MFPRCPRFAIRMVSIPVLAALLTALWVTAADASEGQPKGSNARQSGRCYREVSFNETQDGSFVIRSAWREEGTGKPCSPAKR